MVARRLLIILAVLLGLTALAAGVAPREDLGGGGSSTPVPTVTPRGGTANGVVKRTLDAGATGQRVVAQRGQTVELTVESDSLQTVSLDDAGVHTAEPDSPAHFELLADVPGTYTIDLLDPEQQIGTLEVRGDR
jgi:hypothetical protein